MTISIVICTLGTRESLGLALLSAREQLVAPLEVVLVTPKDAIHAPMLVDVLPLVDLVATAARGLPAQRNVGLRVSRGDLVLFIDDDVLLDRGYLDVMRRSFMSRPELIGATGKVLNWPRYSVISAAVRRMFLLDYACAKRNHFAWSGFPQWGMSGTASDIDFLSGCNMMLRRKMLRDELFREDWSGYAEGEDVDFSSRLCQYGELKAFPDARLLHLSSPVRDASAGSGVSHLEDIAYAHRRGSAWYSWAFCGHQIVNAVRRRRV